MFPKLFEVPFIGARVNFYGPMMVVGFLLAVYLMRRMARRVGAEPDHITNTALYALIAGVIGARIFYVVHHWWQFEGDPWWSPLAVWRGGLEFVGGVILAVIVIIIYLLRQKLSVRQYLDFLAVGLMLGLMFGRVGCFLGNGCCFGKPTDSFWGVRFPYASDVYRSHVRPNPERGRSEPYMELPAEFFGAVSANGKSWFGVDEASKYGRGVGLKPYEFLTEEQKYEVNKGKYRAIPVHPSQLYSSVSALVLCVLLYVFWRKYGLKGPGCTFGLMFILYGPTRFGLEFIRDDNPFEHAWWTIYNGGTISQNLGIYMVILGLALTTVFLKTKPPEETK